MVLEPLNHSANHPGLFLSRRSRRPTRSAARSTRPSCKILDDLYHQQITEGNLIPNIDRRVGARSAYFQVGDNAGPQASPPPARSTTSNVFAHIKAKGFTGIVGMEHGNSKKTARPARGP
jgi:hydroxypyruvate isomerase